MTFFSLSLSLHTSPLVMIYVIIIYFFTHGLFSLQGVSAGKSGAVAMAEALVANQTLQTLE